MSHSKNRLRKNWTAETAKAFVAIVKTHPYVWSESHRNQLKPLGYRHATLSKAYIEIEQRLEKNGIFGYNSVKIKQKLRQLQALYRLELNKLAESKTNNLTYVPKYKWFNDFTDMYSTVLAMSEKQYDENFDVITDTNYLPTGQTESKEKGPDDIESHVDLLVNKEFKPRKRKRQITENDEIILNNANDESKDNHESFVTEDEDLCIDTENEDEATIFVVKSDLDDNENVKCESISQDNFEEVIENKDDSSEFEAFAYSIALQLKKLPLHVAEKLKLRMLSMVADEHVQPFLKSG